MRTIDNDEKMERKMRKVMVEIEVPDYGYHNNNDLTPISGVRLFPDRKIECNGETHCVFAAFGDGIFFNLPDDQYPEGGWKKGTQLIKWKIIK